MSVSKRLRYEILRRDNYACTYCGAVAPEVKLTVDHVVPVALGGSDLPKNLTTACVDCNAGKSATHPDAPTLDAVDEANKRWGMALRHAAQLLEDDREYRERCYEDFDEHWTGYTWVSSGEPVERPDNWRDTIDQLVATGLPKAQVFEAVDIAMRNPVRDTWRYFCGVAWRKVDQMRERAAAVFEVGN